MVLASSATQPERVGEIAFLDDAEHSEWVMVRAPLAEDDPTSRQVFVRQRPGGSTDGGPLVAILRRLPMLARYMRTSTMIVALRELNGHGTHAE